MHVRSRFAILVRRKQRELPWRATEQRKVSTYMKRGCLRMCFSKPEWKRSNRILWHSQFPTIFELANASQMKLWGCGLDLVITPRNSYFTCMC